MSGDSGDSQDAAWRPPAPKPAPTESLTGYDHLVEVGRGGDSVVYRARDLAVDRDVAVKVLLVDADGRGDVRAARFAREIAITVELGRQHPNIVNVLATGTTDSGRPAIVMDFYDAGTVHDRLQALGPLPPDEVVKLGVVLADALAFAHDRGVLHRDVKPQNVLLLPTSWVLADFGIARLADSEHTASVETFTYRHASPQILDGYPPTAADDIWSLGSTLYTLVDGRPPFASDDPDEDSALSYLRRARTEPHRPLDVTGAGGLAGVVDRCLSKEVDGRWPSAGALRDALAELRTSAWEPGGTGDQPDAGRGPVPAPGAHRAEATGSTSGTDEVDRSVPATPAPLAESVVQAEPVALSVLAHAPGPVPDQDVTGLRPDATGASPGDGPGGPGGRRTPVETPEKDEPDVGKGRRRLVIGLGVLALVVGLALGVGGAALRSDGGDQQPAARDEPGGPATGLPVESASAAPVQPGDPQPQRGNPKLRFIITDVRSDGTVLKLKWTDPTDGTGLFTVQQLLPEPTVGGLWQFGDGATEGVVNLSMTNGTRYCFAMSVISPEDGDFGVAKRRCYTFRPAA